MTPRLFWPLSLVAAVIRRALGFTATGASDHGKQASS
jgi:hypothetical protein